MFVVLMDLRLQKELLLNFKTNVMKIRITNKGVVRFMFLTIYIVSMLSGLYVELTNDWTVMSEWMAIGLAYYYMFLIASVCWLLFSLHEGKIKFDKTITLWESEKDFAPGHENWDDYQDFLKERNKVE